MKNCILRFLLTTAFVLTSCCSQAADVTISSLPAITTVGNTTILPVVDVSGTPTTKKATVEQLITGLPAATVSTAGLMSASDKNTMAGATASNLGSTLVKRDSSGNFAANIITAASITGLGAPTNPTDAATKAYVDAAAAGLIIKTPCVAATTTGLNITLAGGAPITVDGVSLNLNDRVLVKNQSDDTENGIYYVQTLGTGSNGTWARTPDADTGAELVTGSYVWISGGTTNLQSAWTMVTPGTIVIGTSHITWNLFSQTTQILASNIIGQIVASQVQDGAINTAKFATGIQPVSLVSSLPSPSGYTGPKVVFNTGDNKLYRYTGSAWTAAVAATDMTGQITTTQISDNSISSPKMQAGSVTAGTIAAGAVTAGTIATNAVTAGTIAAGAVSTTELAAGAVNASKIAAGTITTTQIAANTILAGNIQAGTITADRLNIATLSAISANLGTVTAGTLTASFSIDVASGLNRVQIDNTGMLVAGGAISLKSAGGNPAITVNGTGSYSSSYVQVNGYNGTIPAFLTAYDGAYTTIIGSQITTPKIVLSGGSQQLVVSSGAAIIGPGDLYMVDNQPACLNIVTIPYGSAGSAAGYIGVKVNGSVYKIQIFNP